MDIIINAINNNKIKEYLNDNIELKSSWKQDNGKKISFLANKNLNKNSYLIIGIDDGGEIISNNEKWAKETEENISQHINAYLDPLQSVEKINCINIKNSWIVIIKISNPGAIVKWNNKAFNGCGTTIKEMSPDEIMELTIKLPGLKDFTSQKSNFQVDSKYIESFALMIAKNLKNDPFFTTSNLNEEVILKRLKINGLNTARLLFSNTSFRMIIFDKKNEIISNEKKYGLYNLIDINFINNIIQKINSMHNQKINIPIRAIKEGLANAVAHSAYFESDGDIIIEIYPQKIIITNLSLSESTYFANKWFSRSHKTVNKLLMEILRLCGAVDELGRGKYLIFSDSLMNGLQPPDVFIEPAGRLNRWKLCIYFEVLSKENKLLLTRLKEKYKNLYKSQIAAALAFWRNKKVSEIKKYIDGESYPVFEEILKDLSGPVFYNEENDCLVLRRWARLIIEEGKSSKTFTAAEEEQLLSLCYELSNEYSNNIITVKDFRDYASMGDSASEITLSSNLLTKWKNSGIIEKLKKSTYRFIKIPEATSVENNLELLKKRLFL